jgi:protein gp37
MLMADKTSIEWADASWSPIRARNRETGKVGWFCVHESEGCRFCYAEKINHRLGTGIDFKAQNRDKVEIFLDEKILAEPLHWRHPRKIFPNSMTDWMADFVPDEWRDRMMAVMALCPHHTFLPLTKRADRQRVYASAFATPGCVGRHLHALAEEAKGCAFTVWQAQDRLIHWPLPNVWKGVSCEDQPRADERIPLLRDTPAAVRWVSLEPLLGPVDLSLLHYDGITNIDALSGRHGVGRSHAPGTRLDWVVAGAESGPGARPCDLDWVRGVRNQCSWAGVPFFWKQDVVRGRKISTPELDGRRWVEYPAQDRA